MAGPTLPVDMVNRALDECGLEAIGDLDEGSPTAEVAQRLYWPTLRQLLAGAHWNFARTQIALTMLADATGQLVTETDVPVPWGYMYDWPVDCVHARFVQMASLQTSQQIPIFSSPPYTYDWTFAGPVPFIVASSDRPNDITSQWYMTEGHDPERTRVILSGVPNAQLIYTGLAQYPDAWDPLFEQAFVSGLASRLAMPLIKDRKDARVIRQDNRLMALEALNAARVRDGNEGWTVADHTPDWIQARTGYRGYEGPGVWGYPWCSVPWLDGAAVY